MPCPRILATGPGQHITENNVEQKDNLEQYHLTSHRNHQTLDVRPMDDHDKITILKSRSRFTSHSFISSDERRIALSKLNISSHSSSNSYQ